MTDGSTGMSSNGPYTTTAGFSRTTSIFLTASGDTQPLSHSAATSALPEISSKVLNPCVRLPTLQLPWSSATVANTPSTASNQNTHPAAAAPVRPSVVGGGFGRSVRGIPVGIWLRNAIPIGRSARPSRSCKSRCRVLRSATVICDCLSRSVSLTDGDADEQHCTVEAAVGNPSAGFGFESVAQRVAYLAGPGSGASSARQQCQQIIGLTCL